jgi:hypothetical protein
MPDEIVNADLTAARIPSVHAEYKTIAEFALTFDGYARFEKVADFSNNTLARYQADRDSLKKLTLTELRACLFYEQRRFRHIDEEPENGDREYMNELLDAMRICVKDNKTE